MCHTIYISTDSGEDLSLRNSELVSFERVADRCCGPALSLLVYPQVWYVGSKSGCSCTFRHQLAINRDPCFGGPEDWYPEKPDEIAATLELYGILRAILAGGHRLDLVSGWNGDWAPLMPGETPTIGQLTVSLDEVKAAAFRLFENYRFEFAPLEGASCAG